MIEAEAERDPMGQWERDTYAARMLAVEGPEFDDARAKGWQRSLEQKLEELLAESRQP